MRAFEAGWWWWRRAGRRVWYSGLVLILCGTESLAHLGPPLYAYEIPDTAAIDLFDGSLSDWVTFASGPSIVSSDFGADSAFQPWSTPGGMPLDFDSSDLHVEVWLAWLDEPPRVYVGISRWDDVHLRVGAPQEGEGVLFVCTEAVQFMIDGDHSGGQYSLFVDPSDRHRQGRQAQSYSVMLDSLGGLHRGGWWDNGGGLWFDPRHWASVAPFSGGGGGMRRDGSSVSEFYVTPFDTLAQRAAASRRSELGPGKVIGIGMEVGDSDNRDCTYADTLMVYHLGSAAGLAYRYADDMVDLHLLPAKESTSVGATSWGELKASIRRDNQD